jgi:hypothetical protein
MREIIEIGSVCGILHSATRLDGGSLMCLFTVVGLGIFSLSGLATVANAQTYSDTPLGNSPSSEAHVAQMGICQIGAGGPCNGDTNSVK